MRTLVRRSQLLASSPSASVHGFSVHSFDGGWDPSVSLRLHHPTLVLLEKKCNTPAHFKQILAHMLRLHLTGQTFPMSRLLHYSAVSHPEHLPLAFLLFRHFTPSPNVYIYNIMISSASLISGQPFDLYKCLLFSRTCPNEQTYLSLLKSSSDVSVGRQIHVHVMVGGFFSHAYLQNSLMKMYLDGGDIAAAYKVFSQMSEHDLVACNIMLSGLTREGCFTEALTLFRDMEASGIEPDAYTIVGLLTCSANMKNARLGKAVHGLAVRKMLLVGCSLALLNALTSMYAKCGQMESASKVFDGISEKDSISWNTIIAGFAGIGELEIASRFFCEAPRRDLISFNSLLHGYARTGDFGLAVKLFRKLLLENVRPDKVTAITLICTAAEMGELNQGRCIHGWLLKSYGFLDAFLGSALVDMYCKCGNIKCSFTVFNSVCHKDVTLWTALITGLAFHGYGTKALEVFFRMQEEGALPNDVTLVAVLTACTHAGLVDEGIEIFESMKQRYGVEPGVEHYGCVVDLLARAGMLNEALKMVSRMPMKSSKSIWGAILSASGAYVDLELAEHALKELLELEPDREGGYVLLSNAYAACGKWSSSDKIRESMDRRGVKKIGGCSSLVVDGVVHEFLSSDKRNHRWIEVYCLVNELHKMLKVEEATNHITLCNSENVFSY